MRFWYDDELKAATEAWFDELKAATEAWFEDQIDDFYFKSIDCLKEKWAKCIEVKGDYTEK